MSALFIVLMFLTGLAGLIALMARLEPVLEPAPVTATATATPADFPVVDDAVPHAQAA